MPRSPVIIAAASVGSALWWGVHLALDPDPVASGPAAVLAVSLAVGAVVVGIALLISRSRWARPMVIGLSAAGLGLAAVSPLDAGTIGGTVLSGIALAGSIGPWLAVWLRRLPAAEAPPAAAALALAATALLPALVAAVHYDGLAPADWVLAGVAALTALGLLRALPAGLWMARLGVPGAGIAAGIAGGLLVGPFLAAAAVAAAVPAWRPEVGLSIRPILPSTGNLTIPPELVDPGLLEAAGFDDRGRPAGSSS